MMSLRPKNLARNKTALPCAFGDSIHCRHDLSTHVSLQPFRSTLQPLQLILTHFKKFLQKSNLEEERESQLSTSNEELRHYIREGNIILNVFVWLGSSLNQTMVELKGNLTLDFCVPWVRMVWGPSACWRCRGRGRGEY